MPGDLPDPPVLPFLCSLASRVSNLVGNGERRGQANVLIDAATSLSLTHPSHGGQAWETGTWGKGWALRAVLAGPVHPCHSHPDRCLRGSLKPRGAGT